MGCISNLSFKALVKSDQKGKKKRARQQKVDTEVFVLRRAKEKILFRKWSKRSRASSSKQWPIGIVASGPCREDWAPLKMAPQLSVKIGPLAPARSIPLPSNLFWEQPPVDFAAFLHDYYCVTRSPKIESQQWRVPIASFHSDLRHSSVAHLLSPVLYFVVELYFFFFS